MWKRTARWLSWLPWLTLGSLVGFALVLLGCAYFNLQQVTASTRYLEVFQNLRSVEADVIMASRLVIETSRKQSTMEQAASYHPSVLNEELNTLAQTMPIHLEHLQRSLRSIMPDDQTNLLKQWRFMQLKHHWSTVYQVVLEVADTPAKASNIERLRAVAPAQQAAFTRMMDQFYHACQAIVQRETETARMYALLIGLSACLLVGLIGIGLYCYGILPLRCFQNAGQQWDGSLNRECPSYLRGTAWQAVWSRSEQMSARLRETEQFIRELAVGRPAIPIRARSEHDMLARSCFWLAERWERIQADSKDRKTA